MKIKTRSLRAWLLGGAFLVTFALPALAQQAGETSNSYSSRPASSATQDGLIRYQRPQSELEGLAKRTWGGHQGLLHRAAALA